MNCRGGGKGGEASSETRLCPSKVVGPCEAVCMPLCVVVSNGTRTCPDSRRGQGCDGMHCGVDCGGDTSSTDQAFMSVLVVLGLEKPAPSLIRIAACHFGVSIPWRGHHVIRYVQCSDCNNMRSFPVAVVRGPDDGPVNQAGLLLGFSSKWPLRVGEFYCCSSLPIGKEMQYSGDRKAEVS